MSRGCATCSALGRGRTCGEEKKTLPGSGEGKARRVALTTAKPQHCGTWSVAKKPHPNPQLPALLEVNNAPKGTSVPPAPGAAAAPRACQGLGQSPAASRGCAGAAPATEPLRRRYRHAWTQQCWGDKEPLLDSAALGIFFPLR